MYLIRSFLYLSPYCTCPTLHTLTPLPLSPLRLSESRSHLWIMPSEATKTKLKGGERGGNVSISGTAASLCRESRQPPNEITPNPKQKTELDAIQLGFSNSSMIPLPLTKGGERGGNVSISGTAASLSRESCVLMKVTPNPKQKTELDAVQFSFSNPPMIPLPLLKGGERGGNVSISGTAASLSQESRRPPNESNAESKTKNRAGRYPTRLKEAATYSPARLMQYHRR